jgi:hypothetical protein
MDNRRFGTVPSSYLGGIGLDLMAASVATQTISRTRTAAG